MGLLDALRLKRSSMGKSIRFQIAKEQSHGYVGLIISNAIWAMLNLILV